jgi:hypothetical protein
MEPRPPQSPHDPESQDTAAGPPYLNPDILDAVAVALGSGVKGLVEFQQALVDCWAGPTVENPDKFKKAKEILDKVAEARRNLRLLNETDD